MPKIPTKTTAPKTVICVPSKARAEIFKKKTFRILQHCKTEWVVFVEPQDKKEYASFVPEKNLISIGKNDEGLAFALNFIRKWAIKNGVDFCFKLDDDTHHFYDPEHQRVSPDKVQAKMVDNSLKTILLPAWKVLGEKLAAIGFPGKLFYKDHRRYTHVDKKLEGLYLINPKHWYVPKESEGFDEESYASAFLKKKGLISLRSGMLACEHDLSKLPGGLQSFDRAEGHQRTFQLMKTVDPEIRNMLPTRVSEYSNGATFMTVHTREYNKKFAHRLPVKAGHYSEEVQTQLDKLATL